MFDVHHPNYIYYKWRTYSFAQGDSERVWRAEPFQMSIGGPVWIPPPLPFYDKEAAKKKLEVVPEKEPKENEDLDYFKNAGFKRAGSKLEDEEIVILPYQLKRELINILTELTVKQTDICNAMIFVMENAEYAKPIIKVLKEKIRECVDYDQL
jgi:U2-associated protein SR140